MTHVWNARPPRRLERAHAPRVLAAVAVAVLAGCTTPARPPEKPAPAPLDAGALAAPAPVTLGDAEVQQTLELTCQACHALAYVEQQRLSEPQWVATLTKMRTWGAQLDEVQLAPLARALAARRGPGAPKRAHPRAEVTAFQPAAADEPSADAAVAAAGKAVFDARCLACHGADARGGIGVNLTERPVLQDPRRFNAFVHAGRGRMPPHPDLTDVQLDSLRAWLRTQ